MSWKAVNTSETNNENYGKLEYKIYLGSTLIGTTDKTSFTYTPTSTPYGTFKVVAAYYSGPKSDPTTFELKDEEEEENDSLELQYNGSTIIPSSSGTLSLNISDFTVTGGDGSATVESCTPNSIILPGKYPVTCTVKYNGKPKFLTVTITVTKEGE